MLRDIRLVDVSNRQIVNYPGLPCEYIALSHVWGGITLKSFKRVTILPRPLPQTIEDVMAFVGKLGKQFLWVEPICIDQRDDKDKRHQL